MICFLDVLILVLKVHIFLDLSVIRFLQSYSGSFGEYKYSNISGDNIRTVISAFTEDVLIYIIAYCQSFLGLKCSTIKLYLAGVRHFGITYANRNPLGDQYEINCYGYTMFYNLLNILTLNQLVRNCL